MRIQRPVSIWYHIRRPVTAMMTAIASRKCFVFTFLLRRLPICAPGMVPITNATAAEAEPEQGDEQ